MPQTIVQSTALFFKDGTSDKEYNAMIEEVAGGYLVNFAYGRRGNATSTGTKTTSPVTLDAAEKIYAKLVQEKTSKGYVADGAGTPFSGIQDAGKTSGLVPMLLNPITEDELEAYLKDDEWFVQEKLDGKRIMIRVEAGKVTASNRKGLIVGIPTEVENDLSNLIDMVIDGELIGTTYHMFDLLECEGEDLRQRGAGTRFKRLSGANWGGFKSLALVPSAHRDEASKRKLVQDMLHKEGVVLKHKDSKYVSGRPASGGKALKCKFWSSCTAEVIAINAQRSIQVGVMQNGKLTNVGNVTVPPNYDLPKVGDLVEIKYLYFVSSLYQPQYLGVRDDIDQADSYQSLKPKSSNDD